MEKRLAQISCDPICGFKVRSHSKSEVLDLTKRHIKKVHPEAKYTDKEIESMIESVKG